MVRGRLGGGSEGCSEGSAEEKKQAWCVRKAAAEEKKRAWGVRKAARRKKSRLGVRSEEGGCVRKVVAEEKKQARCVRKAAAEEKKQAWCVRKAAAEGHVLGGVCWVGRGGFWGRTLGGVAAWVPLPCDVSAGGQAPIENISGRPTPMAFALWGLGAGWRSGLGGCGLGWGGGLWGGWLFGLGGGAAGLQDWDVGVDAAAKQVIAGLA
jgi:hypothetical protein